MLKYRNNLPLYEPIRMKLSKLYDKKKAALETRNSVCMVNGHFYNSHRCAQLVSDECQSVANLKSKSCRSIYLYVEYTTHTRTIDL